MLEWHTIETGSKGNCYIIKSESSKIILEAGLPVSDIKKALRYDVSDVEACFITHEHGDHAKAAKKIMEMGIPVYATKGTLQALELTEHYNANPIDYFEKIKVSDFVFTAFDTNHGAAQPCGFHIQHGESKIVFVTDTNSLNYSFLGVNHWFLECNFQDEILQENLNSGELSPALHKIRKNHWEFSKVKSYIEKVIKPDISSLNTLKLIHPSSTNLDMKYCEKNISESINFNVSFVQKKENLILDL